MEFVWFLLIAILSGVFAGMGMGGGTFLIPLITLLMNVKQNVAQCLNLLVFVPTRTDVERETESERHTRQK